MSSTLATLLIIATLLERSLSVISLVIFKENIVENRDAYRNKLTSAKASARYFGVANTSLVHDLQIAKQDLTKSRKEKRWTKICLVFLLSVMISASGIQILGNFLSLPTVASQKLLFIGMDILLSAGLIAGGSQGISEIIKLIQNYRDELFSDHQAAKLVPVQHTPIIRGTKHTNGLQPGLSEHTGKADITWLSNSQNSSNSITPYADTSNPLASSNGISTDHDDSAAYLETRPQQSADIVLQPYGSWTLAKSLNKLREQINTRYPNRNKASDGTIGDTAHCPGTSDHCPNSDKVVMAFDCTHDPDTGCDVSLITEEIRLSEDSRIKYVIYNRQIFSSYTNNGIPPWTWRPYSGSNPHVKHAHFSVLGDPSKYNDESQWIIQQTGEQVCLQS